MIDKYQQALNQMANSIFDNYFLENGLHTAKAEVAEVVKTILNADYPYFVWHYSAANGMWHTIKVTTDVGAKEVSNG